MYNQIRIKDFRGFRNITVGPLHRVNLVVSKNNVGKTAFLEAVTLLVNGQGAIQNFPKALRNADHPEQGAEFWSWLFHNRVLNSTIVISGQKVASGTEDVRLQCSSLRGGEQPKGYRHSFDFNVESGQYRLWIMTAPEMLEPNAQPRTRDESRGGVKIFSTNPMNPVEESRKYHKVMLKKGGEEKVQALLKTVEPRLTKIRPGQVGQHPSIYADIGLDELIPVSQLGQGFCRVLSIYTALYLSEAKVFLIDEVENGIHYSCLEQVWKGIAEVARQENVQVFATTHSWECVVAAQKVFAVREPYDFALHRLEMVNGDVKARTYDKETLATSIESELEVR